MEEESSEKDGKWSSSHYVNDTAHGGGKGLKAGENVPRKPIPRYWHTNVQNTPRQNNINPYKKVNTYNNTPIKNNLAVKNNTLTTKNNTPTAKNTTPALKTNTPALKTNTPALKTNTPALKTNTPALQANKPEGNNIIQDKSVPKEEKASPEPEPLPSHLSIFQSTDPQNVKKTIELLDNDDDVVQLESSDEDEVIEVALPPKPTITIESSDDEEVTIQLSPIKNKGTENVPINVEREKSTSPVPSVVSSVSDDFIRGDCIALNISSRHPDNHSFDFSLHSEIVTPTKKKKKKKNKENNQTTPIVPQSPEKSAAVNETCFATPKSKGKNKKQKSLYTVSENSVPSADVYDSDSNQSIIDISTKTYVVTEKSLPSVDVYETDSNTSEAVKELENVKKSTATDSSDSSIIEPTETVKVSNPTAENIIVDVEEHIPTVDLTTVVDRTNKHNPQEPVPEIPENIVMGNVTGFVENEDYEETQITLSAPSDTPQLGSTKVPAILYDNLDFDNLKGGQVSRSRRFSLTKLRAEMEKFYNESWGGEDFNHKEILRNMSRDKSLWAIDPKDRMPSLARKKHTCNYCNRGGHRDDMCPFKPLICYMCGTTGHMEPRCPNKICLNCGAPNHMYSTQCRNCAIWRRINCAECGQNGHPASHCPDVWRRYHNTTDFSPLEENYEKKKYQMLFCSGCARRGHLVDTCRSCIPFSGLPINSPYVHYYRPIYPLIQYQTDKNSYNNNTSNNQNNYPKNQRSKSPYHKSAPDSMGSPAHVRNDRNKRQSKSPTVHATHTNKKRNMSTSDGEGKHKSPAPTAEPRRKLSQSKELENIDTQEPNSLTGNVDKTPNDSHQNTIEPEKAPDFIPIFSSNRDKKGQIIQDNEVSDTSDVVTSAKIYVTNEMIQNLKTEKGQKWLKETTEQNNVHIENSDITLFLSVKGKVADQNSFQAALRNWAKSTSNEGAISESEANISQTSDGGHRSPHILNVSKFRTHAMKDIRNSLDLLKTNRGDPRAIYKELLYLRNQHQQLLSKKNISPDKLSNNNRRVRKIVKELNIILLGQAGLAGGSNHVDELHALHEKLVSYRHYSLPNDFREEIAVHYNSIFGMVPRNDYEELLKAYYQDRQTFKKRKKNSFKDTTNPKIKTFNSIPSPQKSLPVNAQQKSLPHIPPLGKTDVSVKDSGRVVKNNIPRSDIVKATYKKLLFYQRRLTEARPCDAVLKKTKIELVKKLHTYIGSLGNSNNSNPTSAKTLKKVRKVQEQAQVFLNNQHV